MSQHSENEDHGIWSHHLDGQLKEFSLKDFGITSDQIKDDDAEE